MRGALMGRFEALAFPMGLPHGQDKRADAHCH